MKEKQPTKPAEVDPLAAELLTGLSQFSCSVHIVFGGYFALKHYCDYRLTHDVDAWWSEESGESDRNAVRQALEWVFTRISQNHGLLRKQRRFGETESWELIRVGVKAFSFQIAARTIFLEPRLASPWPPMQIESLADNLGSKMNALVQRGAPRDFVDIRQVVASGLAMPHECWALWERKNPDLQVSEAWAEAARHLQELEIRRPLETISDTDERDRARDTRLWFREVFFESPP